MRKFKTGLLLIFSIFTLFGCAHATGLGFEYPSPHFYNAPKPMVIDKVIEAMNDFNYSIVTVNRENGFVTAKMYGVYITATVQQLGGDTIKVAAFAHSEPSKYDPDDYILDRREKIISFFTVLDALFNK